MSDTCTEDRLLKDVRNHSMQILRDDGVFRHIDFSDNGSSTYRFNLITWPGFLCITGDCGTYVFQRAKDMFDFFRPSKFELLNNKNKHLFINPGYWGEKLESIDAASGYKEFNENDFRERVKYHFDAFWEDFDNKEAKNNCWYEIDQDILSRIDDGEHYAYAAIYEFNYKTPEGIPDFQFDDFFDGGGTEQYTFRYLWCLYAIVYGILEYDKYKLKV